MNEAQVVALTARTKEAALSGGLSASRHPKISTEQRIIPRQWAEELRVR
jgi:hypothetical protein